MYIKKSIVLDTENDDYTSKPSEQSFVDFVFFRMLILLCIMDIEIRINWIRFVRSLGQFRPYFITSSIQLQIINKAQLVAPSNEVYSVINKYKLFNIQIKLKS